MESLLLEKFKKFIKMCLPKYIGIAFSYEFVEL